MVQHKRFIRLTELVNVLVRIADQMNTRIQCFLQKAYNVILDLVQVLSFIHENHSNVLVSSFLQCLFHQLRLRLYVFKKPRGKHLKRTIVLLLNLTIWVNVFFSRLRQSIDHIVAKRIYCFHQLCVDEHRRITVWRTRCLEMLNRKLWITEHHYLFLCQQSSRC